MLISKNIISVGRLDKVKGFDLLIEAWAKIEDLNPEWSLKIVGSGIEEESLFKKINSFKLKNITLVPETKEIRKLLISSSVYIMSSRSEGLPMVLIEAMECGLPVVAFDNIGAKFMIEDGENGFLCNIGDTKSMAKNIQKIINNKELRKRMGINSQVSAKKYYIENIFPKIKDIFQID